jgi:hypothetical protein
MLQLLPTSAGIILRCPALAMWNTLRRTILMLHPFLILTDAILSFFWREVVLDRTSPCLFLADGLADSFGDGGTD